MDHTALLLAARELRKRLTFLPPTALLMAPGLKAAVPLVTTVIAGIEDLADRVQLVEQRIARLEGIPTSNAIRTLTAS